MIFQWLKSIRQGVARSHRQHTPRVRHSNSEGLAIATMVQTLEVRQMFSATVNENAIPESMIDLVPPDDADFTASPPAGVARQLSTQPDLIPPAVDTSAVVWTAQGPGVIQNGQVEGLTAQNNPVTGAVQAIVAHPTDSDIIWIGTTNGGVWKTTNATAATPVWTPLTDQQSSLSIGSLALDPSDATNNTLIAGVGRYSSLGRDGGARTGLLRTTDGGTTWTPINGGGTLTGKNISGIAVQGNTIVVSVNIADSFTYNNVGIFRSTNGGTTFTQISNGNGSSTGLPGGVTYDLTRDPSNANVLYTSAVFADGVGGQNGIYKSSNFGATWTKVSNSTIDALITNNTSNIEMSVGTSDNVYVGISNTGQLAGLFRSGNGGASWTALDTPVTNENGTNVGINPTPKGPGDGSPPEAIAGGQGAIHFSIVADPSDPNIVYVGGDRQPRTNGDTGTFPNSIGAQNFSGRLFRVNSALASGTQAATLTHLIGVSTVSNSSPHADSRDMTIDASGRIIEVDDGGIYRRSNPQGLGDWTALMGQTLQNTEFHSLTYDSNSNVLFGGAQDVGTPIQSSAGSSVYLELTQGDGGVVAVDNVTLAGSNQSIRYTSFQNLGALRRSVFDATGGLVSTSLPALTGFTGTAQFYSPLVLNANVPSRGLIATNTTLLESTNQFATVTNIAANTTTISTMAYGGFGNDDAIYYGNNSNQLFLRTTAAGSFTQLTAYAGQRPTDIVLDTDDWQTAYVVDSNQVFRTTNAGSSFSDITGNLYTLISAASTIRSVTFVEGRGNVDGVIVGTDVGTYITTSEAYGTWSIYGANLPNVPAMDVQYNAADDVLSVGLLGRGAWTVSAASTTFSEEANVAPIVNDQAFSINENSPNTTAVGTVVASDANAGQVLMYAITAGNASGAFSINSGTGAITVANSSLLNFESTPSFTLTVEVTDNGTPALSDTATITINLNDVNEVPVANASNITTNEDTAKAFVVGDFLFTDAENNSLASIAVSNLTLAVGDTLTVNQGAGAIAVTNGMTILAAEIPTLTYTPAGNANGLARSTFNFTVNDAAGTGTVAATMTINVTAVNDVPVIGGTIANPAVNDNTTIAPFASITVTDPDMTDPRAIVNINNGTVRGDFTPASATGWTRTEIGTTIRYVRIFAPAANVDATIQAALRALVFVPRLNAIRPATTEAANFTVSVSDGVATPVHDSTTTVITTSVNDAPTLGGAAANQPVNDDATIAPFASMTVTDPDTQDMAVRVTILNAAVRGDFTAASATGWTRTVLGNNTFYDRYFPQQSNIASSVQSAIRGLVFQPLTNALKPGAPINTAFSVSVTDGISSATDNGTSVSINSLNEAVVLGGAVANQPVNDTATITPFAAMTVADSDTQDMFAKLTILNGVVRGDFTAASATGWIRTVNGNDIVYTRYFSPQAGIAATVQAAIRGFVFQPLVNSLKPGPPVNTTVSVYVTDGISSATDANTSVLITSLNDSPVIAGAAANQAVNSNATTAPFSTMTVTDPDSQDMFVRVTINNGGLRGDFAAASTVGWARSVNGSNIVYSRYFSPTANIGATVQAAIRALVFQPRNGVPVGTQETTAFSVYVTDGQTSVTDNTTSVITTGVLPRPAIATYFAERDTTTVTLPTVKKGSLRPLLKRS